MLSTILILCLVSPTFLCENASSPLLRQKKQAETFTPRSDPNIVYEGTFKFNGLFVKRDDIASVATEGLCTGTLISDKWVLTVASGLHGVHIDDVLFVMDWTIDSNTCTNPNRTQELLYVNIHPESALDAALVLIKTNINFGHFIGVAPPLSFEPDHFWHPSTFLILFYMQLGNGRLRRELAPHPAYLNDTSCIEGGQKLERIDSLDQMKLMCVGLSRGHSTPQVDALRHVKYFWGSTVLCHNAACGFVTKYAQATDKTGELILATMLTTFGPVSTWITNVMNNVSKPSSDYFDYDLTIYYDEDDCCRGARLCGCRWDVAVLLLLLILSFYFR